MKIGLSYSRCVRDIVDGKVDIKDVLVIVARTNFVPRDDEQWRNIWENYGGGGTFGSPYSNPEWMSYSDEAEQKFLDVTLELYNSGKLHQPRQYGGHPASFPYYWLDCVLPDEAIEKNAAVKDAWEHYKLLARLIA